MYSWLTRLSEVGKLRGLAKLWSASSLRPFEASHRGEKGRMSTPAARMNPGIICRRKGRRQGPFTGHVSCSECDPVGDHDAKHDAEFFENKQRSTIFWGTQRQEGNGVSYL